MAPFFMYTACQKCTEFDGGLVAPLLGNSGSSPLKGSLTHVFKFDHFFPCNITTKEPLTEHLSPSVTTPVPDATGCCRWQAWSPKFR